MSGEEVGMRPPCEGFPSVENIAYYPGKPLQDQGRIDFANQPGRLATTFFAAASSHNDSLDARPNFAYSSLHLAGSMSNRTR